jgi:undecaprenyl-diphosphatase
MHNLNEQLFLFINGLAGQSHVLDIIFIFISDLLLKIVICLTLVYFAVAPFTFKDPVKRLHGFGRFWLLIFSLFIMRALVEAVKMVIAFPRPQQILHNVHALSTFGSFDSFPSAHTAFAFAIATFVYHYFKPTGKLLFLVAILIGISRIFVGVHFPLDVFVGACIGALVPLCLIYFFKPSKS